MVRLAAIVVAVALGVSSVSAQTPVDQAPTIAALQAQVDRLTAVLAQKAGIPDPGMFVNADIVSLDGETLLIGGWGLNCQAKSAGDVSVMIDGVVIPNVRVVRVPRPDVQSWFASQGICAVPRDTGVNLAIDLRPYLAGAHTVQLRIATETGAPPRMTPAWIVVVVRQ